ncbi:hypothetical protein CBR_g46716 [Chara braunii]|uniref:CCHC-type domain-containing protein n=1 Tax=Chara braunii TaxID=69332 RepID=A0A388K425_CHABU|nr:hypothetical protein CBR_g46716 [Chara braunii]|eukprot:GBG64759.1 hypothetical protein CBR_g46716 [Chara braunii]
MQHQWCGPPIEHQVHYSLRHPGRSQSCALQWAACGNDSHNAHSLLPHRDFMAAKLITGKEASCARFSVDGSLLAVSDTAGIVEVYRVSTGERLHVLDPGPEREKRPCTAIRFRPSSGTELTRNVLISCDAFGEIRHWHATSGKCLNRIVEEGNQIYTIEYRTNGQHFATAGRDCTVRVYDETTRKLASKLVDGDGRTTAGHSNRIFAVKFHPNDENVLLSSGWDNTIQIWDIRCGFSVRSIYGPHICGDSMDIRDDVVLTGSWRSSKQLQTSSNGNGPPSPPFSPPKSPHSTPSKSPSFSTTPGKTSEPEKPKKKEKVKMKLSFTFSNKKDESLPLWIAEIQTYVSTAPVELESQVAFTTSCMGGEANQWVLAEANVAGFEDIGEWAKTLTLKQFLAKIKDHFLDKTTANEAFDQPTTIGQKHWTLVEALSREVDRLLQGSRLNLQDSQVLYIYSRALPEPIRGHLVAEAKSGKYNYRQFRHLVLEREQMTSQVKNSYATVVKTGGGGGGRTYDSKRVIWREKRQDQILVVFDDDTMEKWHREDGNGKDSNNESGKGEVIVAVATRGGSPRNFVKKKQLSFPAHPDIAEGKPWLKGMDRETSSWQERMDNAQCLKCGTPGHMIAYCPLIRNPKASSQ